MLSQNGLKRWSVLLTVGHWRSLLGFQTMNDLRTRNLIIRIQSDFRNRYYSLVIHIFCFTIVEMWFPAVYQTHILRVIYVFILIGIPFERSPYVPEHSHPCGDVKFLYFVQFPFLFVPNHVYTFMLFFFCYFSWYLARRNHFYILLKSAYIRLRIHWSMLTWSNYISPVLLNF